MNKSLERYLAFGFGVIFVVVLLVLAYRFPYPTPFQYTVFRIVLALAAGGVAAMIPGFLNVDLSTKVRAGGASAVFVIVYFFSPAALTGVKVETPEQHEIGTPVVSFERPSRGRSFDDFETLFVRAVYAQSSKPLPDISVTQADQLLRPEVWGQHYQSITIDGVRAQVPNKATLVANEIQGLHGGGLTGWDFSVVARHMANSTIDVSGTRQPGATPGELHLYVKLVENSHLLAGGAPGAPGGGGQPGANGADGAKGSDADCGCCGKYHGAHSGSNGGDAGNGTPGERGHDGQHGGLVVLTTIVNPVGDSPVDIGGGQPGPGGQGGPAGTPGRGGAGGLGCTGLGGTAQNENPGLPGHPGQAGANGQPGLLGAKGEYRLQIVPSFDAIVEKVKTSPNTKLYDALLSTK